MEFKLRFYNEETRRIISWEHIREFKSLHELLPLSFIKVMFFTGFQDKYRIGIYDGDILSDYTVTDEGGVKSKMQVFWNEKTGSWHLDNSFKQDKTSSVDLWIELKDFEFEITGNIYEVKSKT